MKTPVALQLVYLDTSVFAGKVLRSDSEDVQCADLVQRIVEHKLSQFTFVTSKFTLIEIAELICRKTTQEQAKALLFDIMNDPDLKIMLLNPEPAHKKIRQREFFDIDTLIANLVNTALKYNIPGFDTIHAHTVDKLGDQIIAVSKDKDFRRFKGIRNVSEVLRPSEFLSKYASS